MHRSLSSILLLIPIFLIPRLAWGQTYVGNQEEIDQILVNIDSFSSYYMQGNIAALTECYTADGKILPPNANIIEGHEAIERRWTLPEGVKILWHHVTPTEIVVVDETAYDVGYYEGKTQRPDGSEVAWRGKYVIVWKKVDGEWKIYLDIWNRVDE